MAQAAAASNSKKRISHWERYLRLFAIFFKVSFVADLEFRINFFLRVVTDSFWYVGQIATFEAIFLHSPTLGTWTIEKMRIFLGILFVVDAVYGILFDTTLNQISEKVRRGDLDLLLTKPVNSQFMISFQRMNTAILGNFLIASGYLAWAILSYKDLDPLRVWWLLLLVPLGVTTVYCIRMLFCTFSLLFTRAENLQYVWYQIYRLGLKPDTIYKRWLHYLCLTIIPVAFVASVPARFVVESPDWKLAAYTAAMVAGLMALTIWVWRRSLRSYTSASS